MDMTQHDDMAQDSEMIKTVLQKIISEMDQLEAERIAPNKFRGGIVKGVDHPTANHAETVPEAEPENQDDQHEPLDPNILKTLLDKAGQADESGALPEDHESELPETIIAAVREKKKLPK